MGQVLSQPISSQLLQRKGNANMRIGASEMQGYRMSMEDAMTISLALDEEKHPDISFFAVFDGHAGDRASLYLKEQLHEYIKACPDCRDPQQLTDAVLQADGDFLKREDQREDGSTCVFGVVKPQSSEGKDEPESWDITVSNVGDSRAILIRSNGDFVALTEDHKPELGLERDRIVKAGGMVQANRVDGQLAMSRAMGDWSYKDNPKLRPEEQKVIATPDISHDTAYPNDCLLICCDGIVEQLTNEQVAKFVHQKLYNLPEEGEEEEEGKEKVPRTLPADVDPAVICKELLEYSLVAGSKDNHSAMIICFNKEGVSTVRADEFVAGPFHPYQNDKQFVKAYLEDAKKHGYSGDKLMEMAAIAEANMPAVEPSTMGETPEDAGPRGQMLQQILARLNGGQGDPRSMQEQLLAFSTLLAGQGHVEGIDEDDIVEADGV
mmetsp:Transcript_20915/g.23263  ORF Transcript_20915/g.23263 Transcript_20915/m.23263 type:complete len:436 (-) Transcript_20915:183-1490(-)|eukprot:CAMPEP_0205824790 /NCGR_PEP_ID=MMETSP0206-20130828/22661_1 /ASSEMBLY_ACC=CAM_ASM_000279 /TAXON_ID=36767 /ORGANISM="Euplotes focardii, Strain TN1" /LENGTH=435 /DNA_ID=CAMNT_0053123229 /DNA_START=56 /DNA_END=1363 /DNA_ORIENTATION=+